VEWHLSASSDSSEFQSPLHATRAGRSTSRYRPLVYGRRLLPRLG
jgi:hypothetical protein